jgi:hypothetical protein
MQLTQSRIRLAVVTALAGGSVALLVATPPPLSGATWSRADDVALAAAWAVAVIAGIWLFAVSAACLVAIGVRRPQLARVFAVGLPPALRRSVEIVLVASCLAVSATPAHAVEVGPGPGIDQPVVRAAGSRALSLTPSSRVASRPTGPMLHTPAPHRDPAPPTTGTEPDPTTTVPLATRMPSSPRSTASAASRPATEPLLISQPNAGRATRDRGRVVVRPGDNLWVIARAELGRRTGTTPDDGEVARYWHAVVDANRTTLRSGNPSLIFPGEIVALPPTPLVP